MSLSTRLFNLQQARRRCTDLVSEIENWDRETIKACNVCGSQRISVISKQDRYGLAVRSGLCRFCGLVFLIDRLSAKSYSRFYGEAYRPLVSAFLGREETNQTIRASQVRYAEDLLNVIRDLVDVPNNGRLLDIGGSVGTISTAFAREYGLQALVLDPSPGELEAARSEGHDTACGLFESWDTDAQSFDVIVCARTIDHFLDLSGALRKMRRLITEDGFLLIDIVDLDQVRDARGLVDGALKIDHCYYLYQEIAPAILGCAGWEVTISEIATAPERVLFVCRPIEPREVVSLPEDLVAKRLREFQLERSVADRTRPRLSRYRRVRLKAGRWLRRLGLKS